MMSIPYKLYRNKFSVPPLLPPNSLQDKHVLITGGNTGLGLATAVHCLNLGASLVVITSRDAAKGEAAKNTIESQTHVKQGTLKVLHLDMSTFDGVREFTETVKREFDAIDFVLLNAGVQNVRGAVSEDGWENSLQVNLLSTALLGLLLLPWMKIAGKGKAHLAIVGSGLHRGVEISQESGWPQQDVLKYWNTKENFTKAGAGKMYSVSKLLVMYVMRELAVLGCGSDGSPQVVVNAMCPGLCKSELAREFMTNPVLQALGNVVMTALVKSTEGGARTLVYAALTKEDENGKYFTHYQSDEEYRAVTEKNIWGEDGQKMQEEVWKEILEVLTAKVPEVKDIAH